MAPDPGRARLARAVFVLLAAAFPRPAAAFRIVDYNVTDYPSVLFPQRQPYFRAILAPLGADVVACQEFRSQAGVDSFLTNVLNVNEPGQWAAAPFVNGNDTDNALFYKPSRVQFLDGWSWYPPEPAGVTPNLRLVNCYRLKPVGYSDASTELRIYSQHLKASTGSANESQRLAEATGIRDSMNAMPAGAHAILLGDFNIYTTTEPAFQKFLENQADNDGRLYDPLNLSGTFNQAAFAPYHTQCPCLTCPAGSGFSGGGLDDRFDMLLPTYNMNDGQGLELLASTYKPVGNDGLHYNLNITDPPPIPEGATCANALWNASDHLPVRVDIRLPARIALAPAALDFGTVIVGAAVSKSLAVSNPALAPAEVLSYSLAATAGFSAPAGSFTRAAGDPPASQPIGMQTAAAGVESGTLSVSSNDPDQALRTVGLSGTVLDHAKASLDSVVALTGTTVDFGTQPAGGFSGHLVRVHDRGYDALEARLAVNTTHITGGGGRFSIAGGFTPVLVAGTAANFTVEFDDAGATPDSAYQATLTFTGSDEPLPGAAPAADLTVLLRAQVAAGATGVSAAVPGTLRFYAPRPNPSPGVVSLGFDLPRAARVRLEIFDLAGRRVAVLAAGELGAAHHELRWAGTDASGARVKAGLYFARFTTPGFERVARLVVMPQDRGVLSPRGS